MYFDFCWVVVHFLGGVGCWWMYCGWWWVVMGWSVMDIFWLVVVDGGEYILAGGGWWQVVMDVGEYILAGGGWWWMVVDGCGWWHSLA